MTTFVGVHVSTVQPPDVGLGSVNSPASVGDPVFERQRPMRRYGLTWILDFARQGDRDREQKRRERERVGGHSDPPCAQLYDESGRRTRGESRDPGSRP
jgi:hypothetical protein